MPPLKAAFLFNFVKFTEWPAEAAPRGTKLTLCILGDSQVRSALEQTTAGNSIDGHEVAVKSAHADEVLGGCHLLYISGLDATRSIALARSLDRSPVLTVSDLAGFAEAGGVINFTVENAKIRFVVNRDAAARARLRLSSKLLTLAKIVGER